MSTYETEINNTLYVVSNGIALNTANGITITEDELHKIVKKSKAEFSSSEWNRTEYRDITEWLEKESVEEDNIIIDDNVTTNFNGIRYNYEFIIYKQDDEVTIVRELISKFDTATGEEYDVSIGKRFDNHNDNEGTSHNVSYKSGLNNTILWYAHEIGALTHLLTSLDFTSLGTTWVKDDVLVTPKTEDIYVFQRLASP